MPHLAHYEDCARTIAQFDLALKREKNHSKIQINEINEETEFKITAFLEKVKQYQRTTNEFSKKNTMRLLIKAGNKPI